MTVNCKPSSTLIKGKPQHQPRVHMWLNTRPPGWMDSLPQVFGPMADSTLCSSWISFNLRTQPMLLLIFTPRRRRKMNNLSLVTNYRGKWIRFYDSSTARNFKWKPTLVRMAKCGLKKVVKKAFRMKHHGDIILSLLPGLSVQTQRRLTC